MSQHALDIRNCIYKRLETDVEFAERVTGSVVLVNVMTKQRILGVDLDDHIWNMYKKQRRIIEVTP